MCQLSLKQELNSDEIRNRWIVKTKTIKQSLIKQSSGCLSPEFERRNKL